jgi:hypothetical protein
MFFLKVMEQRALHRTQRAGLIAPVYLQVCDASRINVSQRSPKQFFDCFAIARGSGRVDKSNFQKTKFKDQKSRKTTSKALHHNLFHEIDREIAFCKIYIFGLTIRHVGDIGVGFECKLGPGVVAVDGQKDAHHPDHKALLKGEDDKAINH